MSVEEPRPDWLEWAAATAAPGSRVTAVRGLRSGGAPWALLMGGPDGVTAEAILRVGEDPDSLAAEFEAQSFAVASGIPAPRVLGVRLDHAPPLLLIEAVAGSSVVPVERPVARLRASGAVAARIAAIPAPEHLPVRRRPIAGVDFAAIRAAEARPHPLLARAERRLTRHPAEFAEPAGFVHGDLWQGNLLWSGDDLSAVIDWDCAGRGHPGVDLGALRLDATTAFGIDAAQDVLDGWIAEAGREPDDLAYGDLLAAVSTTSDLGWFVEAIHEQGRGDLARDVMVARRDAFLEDALARLR